MPKITRVHPLFPRFLALLVKLEPENLSCDGECSKAEVARRRAAINTAWRELEAQFGAKVTGEDVWTAEQQPETREQ